MKKNTVFAIVAMLAAVTLVFTACPIGGGPAAESDISGGGPLLGFDEANPITKSYTGDITQQWGSINAEIQTEGKFVILDLSGASFAGNTITGSDPFPTGNAMNVIKDNAYIKGIILPNSLQTIGDFAFLNCAFLTSVTIPLSVTSIEPYAFMRCKSLANITIPARVTRIWSYAFYECTSLANVTISNGVDDIGTSAFSDCTSLTSVTILGSVQNIVFGAFDGCTSLTSVTFGAGSNISNFGNDVFPEGATGSGGNSLQSAYNAANPKDGTYTRAAGGSVWTKQ